jgi:hypothetical protein
MGDRTVAPAVVKTTAGARWDEISPGPAYDVLGRRDPVSCSSNGTKLGGADFEADRVLLSDPVLQFVTLGSTSKIPRYTSG